MDAELLNFVSERLDQALRSAEILSQHQYKGYEWQVEILHGFNQAGHFSSSIKITTDIYDEEYFGGYAFELSALEGAAIAEMLTNPGYGNHLAIEDIEKALSRHKFSNVPYWVYFEPSDSFVGNFHEWEVERLQSKTDTTRWNLSLGKYMPGVGCILKPEEARAIAAALLTQK